MDRRPLDLDLDREPWALARPVVAGLRAAGHQAVFVGGCVRDLLLGRPVADLDLATDARPEQVEAIFPRCVTVGRQFGVTVVLVPGGEVEVASFRSDRAYIDGRRPMGVEPASEAEDVWRRDYTINALIADPVACELRDHVGGLADLEARRLRVVGDPRARLGEDRLRVLRGLRFAAQLELTIEPATWSALLATSLDGLSRERIWDEWDKAMAHPRRAAWAGLLLDAALLSGLCPLLQSEDHDRSRLQARLQALAPTVPVELPQALLLQPLAASAQDEWLAEEPISRERRRRLAWAARWGRPRAWEGLDLVARRRQLLEPEAALLLPGLIAAQGPDWPQGAALLAELRQLQAQPPAPWLQARDLIALGFRPGPGLGAALRALADAQLAGELPDRAAAEAFASRLLQR